MASKQRLNVLVVDSDEATNLYDPDLQYGLITTDHPGPDVFFHRAAIRPKRGTNLTTGDRVEYRAITDTHRDIATTVRLLPTTQETAATP